MILNLEELNKYVAEILNRMDFYYLQKKAKNENRRIYLVAFKNDHKNQDDIYSSLKESIRFQTLISSNDPKIIFLTISKTIYMYQDHNIKITIQGDNIFDIKQQILIYIPNLLNYKYISKPNKKYFEINITRNLSNAYINSH